MSCQLLFGVVVILQIIVRDQAKRFDHVHVPRGLRIGFQFGDIRFQKARPQVFTVQGQAAMPAQVIQPKGVQLQIGERGIALAGVMGGADSEVGEGTREGDFLFGPMKESIQQNTMPGLFDPDTVQIAPWGDDAWARGAASLQAIMGNWGVAGGSVPLHLRFRHKPSVMLPYGDIPKRMVPKMYRSHKWAQMVLLLDKVNSGEMSVEEYKRPKFQVTLDPPKTAALGLMVLFDGLLQNWLLAPEAFDLVAAGRKTIDIYLAGLGLVTLPATAAG